MPPALVLEGGAFRGLYTAGALDALLKENVMFPYIVGVSAGATNGLSYASRQPRRNLDIIKRYRHDTRYFGYRNLFRERSVFGLKFAYEDVPNEHIPFDYAIFTAYPGKYYMGVTNVRTGEAEFMERDMMGKHNELLIATCAIPLFFPMVRLGDGDYYDGGLAAPIPIDKPLGDGHDRLLIILTRAPGYMKKRSTAEKLTARLKRRRYPELARVFDTRSQLYNETLERVEQMERDGRAVVLRPSAEVIVPRFEKSVQKLETLYTAGFDDAMRSMPAIKSLFD